MRDLEERLRAEVLRRANTLEPSADLPERIHVQVQRQRRRRQALAGSIYVGVAAALVLVVALAWSGRSDSGAVFTDEGRQTPRATAPATTSTTTAPTPIGPDTPLSRSGVGPIVAGMTFRQASDAVGVVISPVASPSNSACAAAYVTGDGIDVTLLAERSDGDLMDSMIRRVIVVVEGRTEEGVAIGDPVADLIAAYGPPTTTYDEWGGPGTQLLVFQSGAFAYSALVGDGFVAILGSGDRAWVDVGDASGCF